MEKFFIVKEGLKLNRDYWEYREGLKAVEEYVDKFMKSHDIEANAYYTSTEKLYIVPEGNDLEKFDKKLGKQEENGLRAFKANSSIGKEWKIYVKENEIKFVHKPFVGIYFSGFGRSKSRLFHIDKILYCTYECDYDFNTPNGFNEIKASEYYKAVEDHNEKVKSAK